MQQRLPSRIDPPITFAHRGARAHAPENTLEAFELALRLGGWNPEIPYVPDTDLWIRLGFKAQVIQCRTVLAACRTHPGQRDMQRERVYRDYLRMLRTSKELALALLRLQAQLMYRE